MERSVPVIALCLLSLGLMRSEGFEVEIKDASNHTCIRASLMANFTVQYETNTSTSKKANFSAPPSVTTTGSSCDGESPLLVVHFGDSLSWSLNFTRNDTVYSGSVLTFTYNTNDTTFFPDALPQGLLSSSTKFLDSIPLNRTYKCIHDEVLSSGNVTQHIWNVTLQAFVQNDTFGQEVSCDADKPTPAPTPVPTPTPTHAPTTTPNATVPIPTSKPLDKPSIGNYSVFNTSGKCLLASMGLQLNASSRIGSVGVYNINPITTNASGTCGNETATLKLTDTSVVIEFYFAIRKSKFYLQEVNVTLTNGSASSSVLNQNLSLWEASVGNSYLCRKEQVIVVSEDLRVNTFEVRVQPFGVRDETYATAEDCFADQDFTVPIIVGAALGVLVILVMVAYFVARKRSLSAGYEHF
ncbi:lysosome-associated membrane glycoprotein 2 isoform X2 [Spea bombifrons]|uniref:lysosome-associated membrane glycoprotein 2 isoform X2 n=1 Tax=Spea bombifrons TaxID=233779 RepID=UPI002349BB8A|nr:lysosome-associated membrane glycoprotein 2 isoform X2 [Spea bombifrons]